MSLDRLEINQRSYYGLLNSVFEADFLWIVSLKILNSGIILKTFTHVLSIFFNKLGKRWNARLEWGIITTLTNTAKPSSMIGFFKSWKTQKKISLNPEQFHRASWAKKSPGKIVIIFLSVSLNICLGAQKNRLIETVLLSTHNTCSGWESGKIRKIISSYPL